MFNLDALLFFMFYYWVSIFIENIYTSEDEWDNDSAYEALQINFTLMCWVWVNGFVMAQRVFCKTFQYLFTPY